MNIGETVKKLRRQKDMTQEQLAEYLNITTQAVSKWETNLSLPDITLIPMLANIFDVTTDTLLGVDIDAKEKRIQEITDRANEYRVNAHNKEAAEILREGIKEYPNSYKIMRDLMSCLWKVRDDPEKTKDERDEMTKEVIHLGEKILAECTDDGLRHSAIQLLCYTYPGIGETEKAVALAEKMPHSCISRENLLQSIYSGNKKFELKQRNIFEIADSLLLSITTNNPTLDDGSVPYTTEELIVIYKKAIAIIDIIVEDGNYGFFNQALSWHSTDIAKFRAMTGDYDGAVEYIKFAAEYSVKDEEYCADKEYTSLLLRGLKFGGVSHNITENDSMHQLEEMKDPAFDPIRERADFIEVEEELKKYAKKR